VTEDQENIAKAWAILAAGVPAAQRTLRELRPRPQRPTKTTDPTAQRPR
jgi:hypothetical protein